MNFIEKFLASNRETKWFILNLLFYILILVATTVYCYGRLDFVRSGPTHTQQELNEQPKN